jgi:hypothetical protein
MSEANKSALMERCGGKTCPRCGAVFVCGMEAGTSPCWCAALPPQPVDPDIPGCLCPDCLAARARSVGPDGA